MSSNPQASFDAELMETLYGIGAEQAWEQVALPDAAGDMYDPYRQLHIEGEPELLAQFRDRLVAMWEKGELSPETKLRTSDTAILLAVPAAYFETTILQRIAQHNNVEILAEGREYKSDPDAIMRVRIEGLLFEEGHHPWRKNSNDGYSRMVPPDILKVDGTSYRFDKVLAMANEIMDQKGLPIRVKGRPLLLGGSLEISAEDFPRVRQCMNQHDAEEMRSSVAHLDRWQNRREAMEDEIRAGRGF